MKDKLRQVVEEAIDLAYFAPSEENVHVETLVLELDDVTQLLDAQLEAIIEEMEIDMRHKDSLQATVIAEQRDKLREARSSLDGGSTSITNSTHE